MKKYGSVTYLFFDRVVLRYPLLVVVCMLAVVGFLGLKARGFRLDASAETLVLENDEDLRYARSIAARYEQADFLVLTYTPKADLFSDPSPACGTT